MRRPKDLESLNNISLPVATAVLFSSAVMILSADAESSKVAANPVITQEVAEVSSEPSVVANADLYQQRTLQFLLGQQMREQERKKAEEAAIKAQQERWKPVKVVRSVSRSRPTATAKFEVSALLNYALKFQGVPYRWGGTDPRTGLDCSAYTQMVFRKFGVEIPRTSAMQFRIGVGVARSNLKPGDLVFFSTNGPGATHVGIYIADGKFISATTKGVRVQNINDPYWNKYYRGSRRVR